VRVYDQNDDWNTFAMSLPIYTPACCGTWTTTRWPSLGTNRARHARALPPVHQAMWVQIAALGITAAAKTWTPQAAPV
jgi:hypothetical protein